MLSLVPASAAYNLTLAPFFGMQIRY